MVVVRIMMKEEEKKKKKKEKNRGERRRDMPVYACATKYEGSIVLPPSIVAKATSTRLEPNLCKQSQAMQMDPSFVGHLLYICWS